MHTFESNGAYVRRVIDDDLDALFPQLPAILLDGPKAVGKTSTAMRRCRDIVRLDVASQLRVAAAEPDRICDMGQEPLLIDEWQRLPAVWDAVRRAIDEDTRGGRFLLTGSQPAVSTALHSGAGRITSLRMRPLTLIERRPAEAPVSFAQLISGDFTSVCGPSRMTLVDYADEIIQGGLPGARHLTGRAHRAFYDSYLELIVTKEIADAGFHVRHPQKVEAWLRAYAASTATATSYEKIRNAATVDGGTPAKSTVITYIELLSALRILDSVPGWLPSHNRLRRLGRAPKHHLADPALAVRALKIKRSDLMRGDTPHTPHEGGLFGALFESLATLSVKVFAQSAETDVFHLRTNNGDHEVDLIAAHPGGIAAIEVKLSATVVDKDVRHLHWLKQKLGDECSSLIVIHTGPHAYVRPDGVAVVPLALLGS
tara:strand:+ start:75727 stop:77010 length:1284 start_codon:yes stop_codon:yes gene_type:complete